MVRHRCPLLKVRGRLCWACHMDKSFAPARVEGPPDDGKENKEPKNPLGSYTRTRTSNARVQPWPSPSLGQAEWGARTEPSGQRGSRAEREAVTRVPTTTAGATQMPPQQAGPSATTGSLRPHDNPRGSCAPRRTAGETEAQRA